MIVPYNRDEAVAYAKEWALSRNPKYFNFDGIGGDCTNFVSQCLYAGSGVMNETPIIGWYYHSAENRSASWTSVEYLYLFLKNNMGIGPFGKFVNQDGLMKGDIIQLGNGDVFYHSLFVLATEPEILVAAHTDDSLYRPLSTYFALEMRMIHSEGVRLL